jgi:ABC-type branched-subunit amino acid transport system substrate-binding protein
MHIRRKFGFSALVVALALTAAACGSDSKGDDAGAKTDDTTASSSSGDSGGFTLDDPVKLALMFEVKGESAVAVDDFNNGATMAIKEINAAGGVGGKPIESFRIPASPLDPQRLGAQFLEAVDKSPTAMVGFPSSLIAAIARNVTQSEIPIIGVSTPAPDVLAGAKGGSDWLFAMVPPQGPQGESAVRFAKEELSASKLSIIHGNEAAGTAAAEAISAKAKDVGLTISSNTASAPTVTDLTSDVIAARDADVIAGFLFPNPLTTLMKQLVDNGSKAKVIANSSTPLIVPALSPAQRANLYGALPCSPASDQTDAAKAFAAAYKEAYGSVPSFSAVVAYDAVKLIAQAVEQAKSSDHDKIREALASGSFDGGACQPAYKADEANVLGHQIEVVSYADGLGTVEQQYDIDPLPRGKS